MPTRSDFYLNSKSSVVEFETIQISHPDFSQTYFFVRNHTKGLTATLETAASQLFEYMPMTITENTSSADLDYGLTVEVFDTGEVLPGEMDAIISANGLFVEPTLVYRTFRSDDLSAPMYGPIELAIKSFNCDKLGFSFEAFAKRSNSQKTGEDYSLQRFPMLRAYL